MKCEENQASFRIGPCAAEELKRTSHQTPKIPKLTTLKPKRLSWIRISLPKKCLTYSSVVVGVVIITKTTRTLIVKHPVTLRYCHILSAVAPRSPHSLLFQAPPILYRSTLHHPLPLVQALSSTVTTPSLAPRRQQIQYSLQSHFWGNFIFLRSLSMLYSASSIILSLYTRSVSTVTRERFLRFTLWMVTLLGKWGGDITDSWQILENFWQPFFCKKWIFGLSFPANYLSNITENFTGTPWGVKRLLP